MQQQKKKLIPPLNARKDCLRCRSEGIDENVIREGMKCFQAERHNTAPNNDGNGTNSGHVGVYAFENDEWVQIGSFIDGEADCDESGWSVSQPVDGCYRSNLE
jgi:hypothetical protein